MPFKADAAARSSFLMISGSTARHVGVSMASPADNANVRPSSIAGDMSPAIVVTARTIATPAIHSSLHRISLRRSTMSPIAPAGSVKRKKGSADAVCVNATYIGPAPSDTMSQAAPTDCMKVPTSDMTSASGRLRKSGVRSGRQRLAQRSPQTGRSAAGRSRFS